MILIIYDMINIIKIIYDKINLIQLIAIVVKENNIYKQKLDKMIINHQIKD